MAYTDDQLKDIAGGEDILDFLDRTENLTQDEVYRMSVATTGRADGITDVQNEAARIPKKNFDRFRAKHGLPPSTVGADSLAPAPSPATATFKGPDGNEYLPNGHLAGVVRPANYDQLESTKMMRRMEQGLPASDDPGEEKWRNQIASDAIALKRRKRVQDSRNGLLAETALRAIAQVNSGGGEIYHNGGKTYRRVKFSARDEAGPVADLNRMNAQMGKSGHMGGMGVFLEVGEDGKPVAGAKPRIWYTHVGDDGKKSVKELSDLGTVQEQWVRKYLADNPAKDGEKEDDRLRSARRVAAERFGGNYAAWDLTPTAREKFEQEQREQADKVAAANKELDQKDAQFYANLGFGKDRLAEERRQFDQKFGLDQKKYDDAVREFDATLTQQQKEAADKLGVRKMEILANVGAKLNGGGGTKDILAGLPQSFVKSYIEAEVPTPSEDPYLPQSRKPTTEEMRARFNELKELAEKAYGAANGSAYVDTLAATLDGTPSAQQGTQPPQSTAPGALPPVGELGQASGAPAPASFTPTPTPAPATPPREPTPDEASANLKRAQELLARRQQERQGYRERTLAENRAKAIEAAGIDEATAQQYDSLPQDLVRDFISAFDGKIEYNDLYSGKYDKQLAALARRRGDESTASALDGMDYLRKKYKYDQGVASANEKIKELIADAENLAIRKGWSQKQLDDYLDSQKNLVYNNGSVLYNINGVMSKPPVDPSAAPQWEEKSEASWFTRPITKDDLKSGVRKLDDRLFGGSARSAIKDGAKFVKNVASVGIEKFGEIYDILKDGNLRMDFLNNVGDGLNDKYGELKDSIGSVLGWLNESVEGLKDKAEENKNKIYMLRKDIAKRSDRLGAEIGKNIGSVIDWLGDMASEYNRRAQRGYDGLREGVGKARRLYRDLQLRGAEGAARAQDLFDGILGNSNEPSADRKIIEGAKRIERMKGLEGQVPPFNH